MEDYNCLLLEESRIEFREEMRELRQYTKSQFGDMNSQFDEMTGKLDAIIELLPNWLRRNGIEHVNLIGVPSDQVAYNPVDNLLEINNALDSDGSSEMFTAAKRSWIDSEVQRGDDRYLVEEESIENKACKVFAEMAEPILKEDLLDIEITKTAHYLLDERVMLSPLIRMKTRMGNCNSLCSFPYIIETSSGDSGSNWVSGLLFNTSKIFDPGTLALFKQEDYECQLNAHESWLLYINSVLFQVASSSRNETNLNHDLDYYQGSEITAENLDEVLVESEVFNSEEMPELEDYVGSESEIKGSLIEDDYKLSKFPVSKGIKSCEYSVVCVPNALGYKAIVIASLELDVYLCVDAMLMIIFDPGGVKQYWDKMPSTSFAECCFRKAFKLLLDPSGLNALHCATDELCRTDLCSRHKNNQEYSAFGECKNVLYFTGYDAMFLFDPGEKYSLLRAWNWTGDFEDRKEQQGHNMMRENAKYVLFSFDPGGVSWPSSDYRVSNLKCFTSSPKLVPYSFNNASRLFIRYGFIAIVIFPSTCDANGDRSIALNIIWDNNRNKLALLHNFLHTQPANLFAVALVKIKTGILPFVFDPGGSLLLQMDFDALLCLVADVLNFSIDWDYTINMGEIISKEIGDKYSQVQLVFTMALKSLDIGFSKVEIDDVGNIITDINMLGVRPLTKLGPVLIFELHRHDDEAGCGQLALVVLSPSSMIEMCLVQVLPKIAVGLSMLVSAIILNVVPIGIVSSIYSQRVSNFSAVSEVTTWCARHHFKALSETAFRTIMLRFIAVKLVVRVTLKDRFRKTKAFFIFVWDPGLLANSIYILEDKDEFKRAGKRIILMDITWVIIAVIKDVQNSWIIITWCQMVVFFILACDYAKVYSERLAEVYIGDIDGVSHGAMDDIDDIGSTPYTTTFFSLDMEHYIWDPGLFILAGLLRRFWCGFSSHHLEDKVAFEGKDMSRYRSFNYNFICIFEFMYLAVMMSSY